LRLARNGITLRYRSGEDGPPWTVKLPEGSSAAALRRSEVSFDGAPGPVPPRAADLVRAYARSRPLVPVAHLHTDRAPIEICGPDGGLLAEITDDRVAVYDEHGQRTGGFREIEVEVRAKGRVGRRLLRAAISRLVAAGCRAEPPIPKVIRVLGQRASGPPDVVVPPIGAGATIDTLVRYAIARRAASASGCPPTARWPPPNPGSSTASTRTGWWSTGDMHRAACGSHPLLGRVMCPRAPARRSLRRIERRVR
jgi:hypothetical protein